MLRAVYDFGDVLYLTMRDECLRGKVVAVVFTPGNVFYRVSWGNGETSEHHGFELSRDYVPAYCHDSPNKGGESLASDDADADADAESDH